MLDERLPVLVPASVHDLVIDSVSFATPPFQWRWTSVLVGRSNRAVESDPTHQPPVREVLPASSGFPDALFWLIPVVGEPIQDLGNVRPTPLAHFESTLTREVQAVDRLAVDVKLQLVGRTVPDPHRTRSAISLPVRQDLFSQIARTIDPIHD